MATDQAQEPARTTEPANADPLGAVRDAAGSALEAQAAGGSDGEAVARLTAAAKAALDAGHGLAAVAAAEAAGQEAARPGLRAEVLRDVARSAKKKREATAEHDAAVSRAAALGLGAREIAERAGVAHGTVAAIVRRHTNPTRAVGETAAGDGAGTGGAGK